MTDLSKLWQDVLKEVELSVSYANFSTWFKDTNIMKKEDGTLYISVPNTFTQEWLQKKFHNEILRIFKLYDDEVQAIEYIVERTDIKAIKTMPVRRINKESLQITVEFEFQ